MLEIFADSIIVWLCVFFHQSLACIMIIDCVFLFLSTLCCAWRGAVPCPRLRLFRRKSRRRRSIHWRTGFLCEKCLENIYSLWWLIKYNFLKKKKLFDCEKLFVLFCVSIFVIVLFLSALRCVKKMCCAFNFFFWFFFLSTLVAEE